MELRLLPSDDGFNDIDNMSYLLSIFINPQLFFGLELPEVERQAAIAEIRARLEELTH